MTRPPVVDVRCPRCGGAPIMYVPERWPFQPKPQSEIDFKRDVALSCGYCGTCKTWWCAVSTAVVDAAA